jgi:hypothetical protein
MRCEGHVTRGVCVLHPETSRLFYFAISVRIQNGARKLKEENGGQNLVR